MSAGGLKKVESIKNALIHAKTESLTSETLESLFDELYTILSDDCEDELRIHVNDALSVWFLKARRQASASRASIKVSLEKIIVIFEYVIDFMGSSHGPLKNSLNGLLSKMVTFVSGMKEDSNTLSTFIDIAMRLPSNSKQKYQLVEVLSKQSNDLIDRYPSFLEDSFNNMASSSLAGGISKCLQILFSNKYPGESEWIHLVLKYARRTDTSENVQRYLLPILFKHSGDFFIKLTGFMEKNSESNDTDTFLMMNILVVGKGVLTQVDIFQAIGVEKLKSFLVHKNPQFRFAALSLMLSTTKTSEPISGTTYKLIKECSLIEIYMNDHDADTRNAFISILSKFLVWVKGSLHVSDKTLKKLEAKNVDPLKQEQQRQRLSEGKDFMTYLVSLMNVYLLPSSTYPQVSVSYAILGALLELNFDNMNRASSTDHNLTKYPFALKLFDYRLTNTLTLNLFDNYDDVREMSFTYLTKCPKESLVETVSTYEKPLIERAFNVLSDLRGRRAEGGAMALKFVSYYIMNVQNDSERFSALVGRLTQDITDSLSHSDKFTHGHIHALVHIYELLLNNSTALLKQYVTKSTQIIFNIWDKYKHFLIDEMKVNPNTDAERTAFNYAWRIIQASNDLAVFEKNSFLELGAISHEEFISLNELTMEQLELVKHRGTLLSLIPSFVTGCQICFDVPNLKNYPIKWLEYVLGAIVSKNQFITRRSGSYPFLISSILTASSKVADTNTIVDSTLLRLFEIAESPYTHDDKFDLPQVHAFNSIKHIFEENSLSKASSEYLNRALRLAISHFDSENWSIRNCSIMLYTAVGQKIFGSKKRDSSTQKLNSRMFFSRYPGIDQVLLKNLEAKLKNSEYAIVPTLDLLSRLDVSGRGASLVKFVPLVHRILGCPSWKVREIAARALAAILTPDELIEYSKGFLIDEKVNLIHGELLAVLQIVERLKTDPALLSRLNFGTKLLRGFETLIKAKFNWIILNSYLNTINALVSAHLQEWSIAHLNSLGNIIVSEYERISHVSDLHGARNLCLVTILDTLAREYSVRGMNESVKDLLSLGVTINIETVQLRAIEIGHKVECLSESKEFVSLLWQLVMSKETSYLLKARCLELLGSLLELRWHHLDHYNAKSLIRISRNVPREIRCQTLIHLGLMEMDPDDQDHFSKSCESFYKDFNPLEMRWASIKASANNLKTTILPNPRAVALIVQGLSDTNESIRDLSADTMSQHVFKSSPVNPVSALIKFSKSIQYYNIALFLLTSLDTYCGTGWKFDDVCDNAEDWEDYNLFINRVVFAKRVTNMVKGQEVSAFQGKLLNDISAFTKLIEKNGNDSPVGWSSEKFYFNFASIVRFSGEITPQESNEILALRQSATTFHLNQVFEKMEELMDFCNN